MKQRRDLRNCINECLHHTVCIVSIELENWMIRHSSAVGIGSPEIDARADFRKLLVDCCDDFELLKDTG